jgi:branched-chain amino acid transport system ATP-binding protein
LAGTLSGGEQQMLAVARALMADPVLLLCDEISLGLSPRMANRVYDGLHEISRAGVAIMLVEQDVRRSLEFSDFVYFLREGRVVLAAQPATISEDLARKAYFGLEGPGGFCEERP